METCVTLAQGYTWGLDLSGSWQGAGGVGGLLCIHRGPGTDGSGERTWTAAFHPTYDGNGNISEYLEYQVDIDPGTSGNQPGTVMVAHFEYDSFGGMTASSGAVADFTYRFSTKPQDFETGLYYYGYRYYDPVKGRWPSRDPIGERGGVNLYSFSDNSTITNIDVLGLMRTACCLEENKKGGSPIDIQGGKPTLAKGAGIQPFNVTVKYKKKGVIEERHGEEVCCDPEACLFTQWVKAKYENLTTGGVAPFIINSHGVKIYPDVFVDDGYYNQRKDDKDRSIEGILYTDTPTVRALVGSNDLVKATMSFKLEVVDIPTNELLADKSFTLTYSGSNILAFTIEASTDLHLVERAPEKE